MPLLKPSRRRAGLIAPMLGLVLAGLACNTLFPPRPEVAWDTDPAAIVIRADTCCGMLYDPNGIPEAQLWGDGTLIWVQYEAGAGSRRVLVDVLSPDEVTDLLQSFVDAGFFGWKDFYEPAVTVYDAPSTCIGVNLASQSKSVCDLVGNPPGKFYELYGDLVSGAGHFGGDYAPTRGYLQAALSTGGQPPVNALPWPAESLGLSLAEASGGIWIEGEALQLAWRMVNASPFNPIVQEGEAYYSITLLVPGITRNAPPAE